MTAPPTIEDAAIACILPVAFAASRRSLASTHAARHAHAHCAPDRRSTKRATALRQEGVLVKTADSFVIGRNAAPHAIRICMSGALLDSLARGLAAIGTTLEHWLEGGMAASYAP
ncbi:hypothetical protein AB4Y32_03350 [Paraburkholderia phymatum]|uniref:Uncharacterized protein n=1 Tax=Paraburkholderia phymatum TaxID=148447 RepID=A0ACC6TTT5_9BURK